MFIRVEPKDWNMVTVLLYFNKAAPNPEDGEIRQYFSDRGLAPRRTTSTELEGDEFEVMSFGGCYLGRPHLDAIARIQEGFVQREVLAEEIPALLKAGPDAHAVDKAMAMDDEELTAAVEKLAEEFHIESSFELDAEGQYQVVLNAEEVQASFLRLGI